MKVDNSLTLPIQRLAAQNLEKPVENQAGSQVAQTVKELMAENPIVMDAVEIKSILFLGIKGDVNLKSTEGQSIDTFA